MIAVASCRSTPTFQANGIGLDIVRSLTDGDLKEIGLSIGDRKRVIAAIANLAPAASPQRPRPPPMAGAPVPRSNEP